MGLFGHPDRVPAVMGHRGLQRPGLRENTPAAFAAAVAEGAGWIELDVRRSADGVLVLHHDGWTPDGVPVVDRTAAELAEQGLATFAEALAQLPPGIGLNVEVKNLPGEPDYDPEDTIVELVAAMVSPLEGQRPLFTSSFNPLTVERLVAAIPSIPCSLIHLRTLGLRPAATIAKEQGAVGLSPQVGAPGLDAEGIAAVHAAGLEVLVWTVNDPAMASELAAAGADGLCTDYPALLVGALDGTEQSRS